jgi:hypothetical protein
VSWVPLADVVASLTPTVTEAELAEYQRLAMAINYAITVATEMPSTLDPRARSLVITKLQEAGHWTVELVRAADRPKTR